SGPIRHPFLPNEGVRRHDATVVRLDDLSDGRVALVVLSNVDGVPSRRADGRRGSLRNRRRLRVNATAGRGDGGGTCLAVDHDGRSAFPAADLRQAVVNLCVGYRVLGWTGRASELRGWAFGSRRRSGASFGFFNCSTGRRD